MARWTTGESGLCEDLNETHLLSKLIPLVRGAVVQVGRGDARCAGSVIVGQLYQALHDDAVQSGAAAAPGFCPVSVAIEWRR